MVETMESQQATEEAGWLKWQSVPVPSLLKIFLIPEAQPRHLNFTKLLPYPFVTQIYVVSNPVMSGVCRWITLEVSHLTA